MKTMKACLVCLLVTLVAACGGSSNESSLAVGSLTVSVSGLPAPALPAGEALIVKSGAETLSITSNGNYAFSQRVVLNSANVTLTSPASIACRFESSRSSSINGVSATENIVCGSLSSAARQIRDNEKVQMYGWYFSALHPSLITATFSLLDVQGDPLTGAALRHFEFEENGTPLTNSAETFLHIEPVNNATLELYTILVLDISRSFTADDIDRIKQAARDAVAARAPNQNIAILVFDDAVTPLQIYTKDDAVLGAAIDSIPREPSARNPSTNLYQAVQMAAQSWDNIVLLDSAHIGYAILITDGKDTAATVALDDIEDDLKGKWIYSIAIGNEVDIEALASISSDDVDGSAGRLIRASSTADLSGVFQRIIGEQENLVSGLHALYYVSPKRGSEAHTFKMTNHNVSRCSTIMGDVDLSEGATLASCSLILEYQADNFVGNNGLLIIPGLASAMAGDVVNFYVPSWYNECDSASPNYVWNLSVNTGTATGSAGASNAEYVVDITATPLVATLTVEDSAASGICQASYPLEID